MDHATTPGVRILVSPEPRGPGFAAPPPPPGNLQDVRVFPVPGEDANLRVIMIDGDPWFVAADVATMLGYRDAANAIRLLKDREKGTRSVSTPGGLQEVVIISEAGFYRLVMRSQRPEADAFQTWVTAEVLPQIRRTGAYTMQRELTKIELLELALEAERAKERMAVQLSRAERQAIGRERDLELKHKQVVQLSAAGVQARELLGQAHRMLTEAQPKVEGYDQLLNSDGNYSLAAAAQAAGMGRQKFIAELARLGGIIVRPGTSDHLRPYQQHVKAGRFVVKIRVFDVVKDGQAETRSEGTTYVTPKGLAWLLDLWLQERNTKSKAEAVTAQ